MVAKDIPTKKGDEMTIKGVIASIVAFLTKVQDFLAPFEKQFEQAAQASLTQIVGGVLANTLATGGANLSTAELRDSLIKEVKDELLTAGIKAGETAILNTLQALYTNMFPEKAVVESINPAPVEASAEVPVETTTGVENTPVAP